MGSLGSLVLLGIIGVLMVVIGIYEDRRHRRRMEAIAQALKLISELPPFPVLKKEDK